MKIISLENTALLEIALNRENADFDSVKITCDSVDNSPSGVMYTAKYKVAQKNNIRAEPSASDNKQMDAISEALELLDEVVPEGSDSMHNLYNAMSILQKQHTYLSNIGRL